MKLYQKYKEVIKQIGNVEIAWFTSFNLDPDLVEKFLLSVLVGTEPSELRTAEDYEAINIELNNIDIKILYDYRALNLRNQKRTCVDFIPINPSQTLKKDEKSIFHPKVIFLKGNEGAYLITGSANLSISAWSSNKEAVIVKRIENKENAEEILSFFRKLGVKYKQSKQWLNTLNDNNTDWNFIHSLESKFNLFKKLFNTTNYNELSIWSPYFSKNTYELLNRIKKYNIDKISIIPNVDEAGKISIEETELQKLKGDTEINIKHFKESDDRQALHHAKVWLISEKIAIGSWNCSFVATGEKVHNKDINIEAGIIANIANSNVENWLKQSIDDYDNNSIPDGQAKEELDEQWEDVLNKFTVNISIIANWDNFTYQVENIEDLDADYKLLLPHCNDKKIELKSINGLSFKNEYIKLLKNKFYTVFNSKGEEIFKGYIREIGKEKRPVYTYVSLSDLFESLIKNPLAETQNKTCRYSLPSEEGESNSKQTIEYKDANSYYIMFVSFQKLYDEIYNIRTDKYELDKLGYRLPGSLINIKSLVEESVCRVLTKDELKTDLDKSIYYFFIIQEINRCISLFNKYCKNTIEIFSKDLLKSIIKQTKFGKYEKRFINKLRKEYGYEEDI